MTNSRSSVSLEPAGALTLAYSYVVNRVVPKPLYVPVNLTAAGAFVLLARRAGSSWADMGLRRDRLARGLRVGVAVALPFAVALALGVALPATRKYFADRRVIGLSAGKAFYDALVRIPVGTAVCEELIFRGAIYGAFLRERTPVEAASISSLLFGIWHVFPTLDTLHLNPAWAPVQGDRVRAAEALTASIVATTAAGYGFTWLRTRADSVVAPMIVHAAISMSAFIGARRVVSLEPGGRRE